jgi:hypothetical protein
MLNIIDDYNVFAIEDGIQMPSNDTSNHAGTTSKYYHNEALSFNN